MARMLDVCAKFLENRTYFSTSHNDRNERTDEPTNKQTNRHVRSQYLLSVVITEYDDDRESELL